MCNVFSGHVVTDKDSKDWGKVLIVTGIHHEEDREHPSVVKFREKIAAWETVKESDLHGAVKLTHDCGQDLTQEETNALIGFVKSYLGKMSYHDMIREIASKSKNVTLRGESITSLPDGLSVGGNLYLEGTGITSLPDGLSVGGDLDLRGTGITSLPDGLSVGGALYLRGTGIASLPDGLSVGGALYLRGTGITSLPDGLSVGGNLYLEGTGITSLPDGLSVGGEIYR